MERPLSAPTPPLKGTYDRLSDAFEAAADQFGDRLAYVDGAVGGTRVTFGEWFRRSDALAAVLVGRGVRRGDVVAIMFESSVDYAIAYGAVVLAGAVVTGINTRLGAREIESILDRAAPGLVFFDANAFGTAPPRGTIVLSLEEARAHQDGSPLGDQRPKVDPDDPAVIIWTSGTTGVPKGAWFDQRNLEAAVWSAGIMSRPFDVKLASTPFPHAGYMAKLWDQLAWATTNVISPTPWRAADTLRLIAAEGITVAAGVPTQWAKLLDEPGIAEMDVSTVRIGLAATAPAPPELIERVTAAIGCPLVVRYAMTESPSIAGTEPDDPPDVQFRTVGRPQSGMTVEIVDEHGLPVAPGEVGRVRVSGSCVMRGYWRDPELSASVLDEHGWLTSTDLARWRPDGNLVLVGRSSDMYIRGGYNVYPLEVENVLAEHPLVDRAAVVGVPTEVIGEIGVAFVVPAEPANPPTLPALRAWVADRLADYKSPDELHLVDALPLTTMMKVDKRALVVRVSTK